MLQFHPEISAVAFAVSSTEDASLNGQVKQTRTLKRTQPGVSQQHSWTMGWDARRSDFLHVCFLRIRYARAKKILAFPCDHLSNVVESQKSLMVIFIFLFYYAHGMKRADVLMTVSLNCPAPNQTYLIIFILFKTWFGVAEFGYACLLNEPLICIHPRWFTSIASLVKSGFVEHFLQYARKISKIWYCFTNDISKDLYGRPFFSLKK